LPRKTFERDYCFSHAEQVYLKDGIAEASPEDLVTIALPPETEQLARRVAARSGKTLEDVLKAGVEMEARIAGIAVVEASRKPADVDRARDIARRISSRPLLDPRTPRDILEQAWAAPDDRHR
jgi:antitoxin VapB